MEQLRAIREQQGFSRAKLAAASGLNPATIHRIENNQRSPTVETLEKLAAALGVEIADFFPKMQAPLPLEDVGERGEDKELAYALLGERLADRGEARLEEWKSSLNRDFYSGRNKIIGWKRRAEFFVWLEQSADTLILYMRTATEYHLLSEAVSAVIVRLNALHDESISQARSLIEASHNDTDREFWRLARQIENDVKEQLTSRESLRR